jgi:hypothetical protein
MQGKGKQQSHQQQQKQRYALHAAQLQCLVSFSG